MIEKIHPFYALPPLADRERDDSKGHNDKRRAPAPLRILIVEDEVFVAMDAEAILVAAGHEVVSMAASADEAIAKTAQFMPELVLMDIRLIGPRDGIDAALEIKRRFNVPIIFVTANTDPVTHARAMQAKPLAIIPKPFSPRDLHAAISDNFTRN